MGSRFTFSAEIASARESTSHPARVDTLASSLQARCEGEGSGGHVSTFPPMDELLSILMPFLARRRTGCIHWTSPLCNRARLPLLRRTLREMAIQYFHMTARISPSSEILSIYSRS